jgi:menaquinol-cytochrome c reductase iron-sulfur subunit
MGSPDRPLPAIPAEDSRRSFLGAILGLGSAFIGALLAVPVLRYIAYPLKAAAGDSGWTDVDAVARLSGETMPLLHKLNVIYIIKKGDKLEALSAICPHLGCTVPWVPARNEFVCPCHGGTFSPDGTLVSGPPRRSLDVLETKVSGGKLMVKYQTFRPDVSSKEVTS